MFSFIDVTLTEINSYEFSVQLKEIINTVTCLIACPTSLLKRKLMVL